MRTRAVCGVVVWVMSIGCSSSSSPSEGDGRACATDIGEGEVQPFADPTPARTEGITFDETGALFASAQGEDGPGVLLDVALDGSLETVATSESIHGLDSDPRGIVAAGIATGEVLLIEPADGSVDVLTDTLDAPNFVVTTPWDTILVSDDSRGTSVIYEVTWEGAVSTWTDEVPTPNGMVFSLDESTLYVAATFEETGVWRVPVSEDGSAGVADKWVDLESSSAPDGLAIDSQGNVYVALATAGQIVKVDPSGDVTTLATGLTGPASLAFGQGDFDPCSLYVTSLFSTQMSRVGAGVLSVDKATE